MKVLTCGLLLCYPFEFVELLSSNKWGIPFITPPYSLAAFLRG